MPPVLEFTISIVLIFLLLSMVVSGLTEYWNSRVGKNSRSSLLFESLLKVFNDPHNRNFTEALYRHPLIENSKPTENDLPAYLDAKTISQAVIEVIIRDQVPYQIQYDKDGRPKVIEPDIESLDTFELFKKSVSQLKPSDLKSMLQSFLHGSGDLEELKPKIESWYNSYMDRVSGWYKKRMKKPLFITALLVTVFINADLFRISKAVWTDDELRNSLVEQAVQLAQDSTSVSRFENLTPDEKKKTADEIYADLRLKNLPLGWTSELPDKQAGIRQLIEYNCSKYLEPSTFFGWFLMAFALHMGAPFWFEALVKLINIRGAGVKPN